ncbi:MAG: hypothetical protein SWX82_07370 [Cyanobacteriota bacterium]|nr:hypothetical protein [Cyanobacteriota bacterium]
MTTLKFRSQVGKDRILHLDVPVSVTQTEIEVTLIIQENSETEEQKSQLEWQKFIDETYSSLADENLERPPQGDYQVREIIE